MYIIRRRLVRSGEALLLFAGQSVSPKNKVGGLSEHERQSQSTVAHRVSSQLTAVEQVSLSEHFSLPFLPFELNSWTRSSSRLTAALNPLSEELKQKSE